MGGIPERTLEGYDKLLKLLEMNPDGFPFRDAVEQTGLAYPTIKKKVKEWGYILVKEPIMVKRIETIIRKEVKK